MRPELLALRFSFGIDCSFGRDLGFGRGFCLGIGLGVEVAASPGRVGGVAAWGNTTEVAS